LYFAEFAGIICAIDGFSDDGRSDSCCGDIRSGGSVLLAQIIILHRRLPGLCAETAEVLLLPASPAASVASVKTLTGRRIK